MIPIFLSPFYYKSVVYPTYDQVVTFFLVRFFWETESTCNDEKCFLLLFQVWQVQDRTQLSIEVKEENLFSFPPAKTFTFQCLLIFNVFASVRFRFRSCFGESRPRSMSGT